MKKFFILLALALNVSCAKNIQENQAPFIKGTAQSVTVRVEPFICDDTKSAISTTGEFSWVSGDKFGVYPVSTSIGAEQTSQQVMFQIQDESAGTQTGFFTGTGWGLVTGGTYQYFAYYPYDSKAKYDKVTVSYDYKYSIASNSSTAHIREDYLVAPVVVPTQPSDASFKFYHMGALVNFKLNIPVADRSATFYFAQISCANKIFATEGQYDPTALNVVSLDPLSVTYPEFIATDSTERITTSLNHFSPDSDGNLNVYLMLPPTNINGKVLTVTVFGDNGKGYSAQKEMTGNMVSGKTYKSSFTMAEDPNVIINTSESGTANCYIVNNPGKYKFLANVRGNGVDPITDDAEGPSIDVSGCEAVVLWETFNTDEEPNVGDIISSAALDGNYIVFQATGVQGNALIALKKTSTNKIVWSWHIWSTNADFDALKQTYGGEKMMDRNLGALSATPGNGHTIGFYYQWGRPWPFIGAGKNSTNDGFTTSKIATTNSTIWTTQVTTETIGTLAFSASNPTCLISSSESNTYKNSMTVIRDWFWYGNTQWYPTCIPAFWKPVKTMYDPCPLGWKIPEGGESGVWVNAGFSLESATFVNNGCTFTSENAYYPLQGWLGPGYNGLTPGMLYAPTSQGFYWGSGNGDTQCPNSLGIKNTILNPKSSSIRSNCYAIRPCQE